MAMGDGTHKLPVKADVRKAIGKQEGDSVAVVLEERLEAWAAAVSCKRPQRGGGIRVEGDTGPVRGTSGGLSCKRHQEGVE